MKFICFLSFLLLFEFSSAQEKAHYNLNGHITSAEDSTIYLAQATVALKPSDKTVKTDRNGSFSFDGLHTGKYRLHVEMAGFYPIDTLISVVADMHVSVALSQRSSDLGNVTIVGVINKNSNIVAVPQAVMAGEQLDLSRGLSLGETLKQIPGVNSLQSGPTISKPVIHGVYSNRILILNNGVRQEGQNWGNDHAPEIDPFIASKLTVIKGPASLRYGSDAIGGVILVEAPAFRSEPGIDGSLNMVAMTNGRSGTLSGMVEGSMDKKLAGLSWRLQGTLQKAGNSRAAHYYIPNTGFNQRDFSFGLGYQKQHYGINIYGSEFNSTVGITPTSEDLTYSDFLAAIARGRPSEVYDYFTYKLDSIGARQEIRHRLLKANVYGESSRWGRLEAQFAFQNNLRKEFGLDPLTYADIPDNRFNLNTYAGDLTWKHPEWIPGMTGNIGISYQRQHNDVTSREHVEVIPDYDNHGTGVYWMEKYQLGHVLLEGGARYDHKWQQSHLFRRGNALQNTVDTTYDSTANWNRMTANIGATWFLHPHFTVMYNLGTAWRGPSPIELFADGVHMGASRWEQGDANLQVESALNNNLTLSYTGSTLDVELGLYANFFHNYIYITPDGTKQTVAGYYPLYQYKQTPRAVFTGLDLDAKWAFLPHWELESKASIVRGRNQTDHDWLIYIPADRFDNTLKYTLDHWGKIEKPFLAVNNLLVLKQTRVPEGITDAPAPPDYDLWGISLGATVYLGKQAMEWSLVSTNLFNREYKDYLNLFRYYNHDLGRNVALRLKFLF